MPKYKYAALGPNGKKQAGTISAPSSVVARYELIARQLRTCSRCASASRSPRSR